MLGFINGALHLAVWTGRNLFEPRVFRTVDDRADYRRFWQDMQLFEGVVELLRSIPGSGPRPDAALDTRPSGGTLRSEDRLTAVWPGAPVQPAPASATDRGRG
jgi:hypothetical protein